MSELSDYRKKVDRLRQEYLHIRRQVKEESDQLELAQTHVTAVEHAQQIVQGVAQTIQQQAHSQIAKVVSRCLEAIFEDPYTFEIRFEKKRGRTEADLVLVRNDLAVDPTSAAGGGVVDVAAFALRLACLMLSRPRSRKVLILDEPFKHLSRDHSSKIRSLLDVLSKEMKVQFIIVTHSTQLRVGHVIEL